MYVQCMEAISHPVQAVLDVFADPLRDVRFADVDAARLAELAASVTAAAEVVATAEAELLRAKRALQESHDALFAQAQRALAYARVFAENDPVLSDRLDQIALPRSAGRRGRPSGEALLVLEPDPGPRARPSGSDARDTGGASRTRRRSTSSRHQPDSAPTLVSELTGTD